MGGVRRILGDNGSNKKPPFGGGGEGGLFRHGVLDVEAFPLRFPLGSQDRLNIPLDGRPKGHHAFPVVQAVDSATLTQDTGLNVVCDFAKMASDPHLANCILNV